MHPAECTYCHWVMGIHRRTGSKSLNDEWLGPFPYATAETVLQQQRGWDKSVCSYCVPGLVDTVLVMEG